jgi:hypothetical protein
LLDLASDGNDGYGQSWSGPPEPYTPLSETVAIDVLLGGLVMADNASSPTSSTPDPSTNTDPVHKTNLGAIIGGVIGGVAVLSMMVALGALVIRRRRGKKNSVVLAEPFDGTTRDSSHPADNRRQSEKPLLSVVPHSLSGPSTSSPSSALSSPLQAADGSGQVNRIGQDSHEWQTVNLGSLMWQLSEFLRGRSHVYNGNDEPPVYTPSNPAV